MLDVGSNLCDGGSQGNDNEDRSFYRSFYIHTAPRPFFASWRVSKSTTDGNLMLAYCEAHNCINLMSFRL